MESPYQDPTTSTESFLAASADHQDGVFRIAQYALKLIGAAHVGRRRSVLMGLSSEIDNARAMTRTFGFIYALQSLRTEGLDGLEKGSALSLLLYHPLEFWYWLLTATGAPYKGLRRGIARLVSALGAVYGVCEIVSAVRRLRELRASATSFCATPTAARAPSPPPPRSSSMRSRRRGASSGNSASTRSCAQLGVGSPAARVW